MEHTFAKPFNFEGTDYDKIDMDLDALTGSDISSVKREWTAAGNFSALISMDMDFCAAVAARASKLPLEFFSAMPGKEYVKVTQAVSGFLLS